MAAAPKTRPYKHVLAVEVHLWGQHVGSVALDPAYGYYVFAYTPEFAAKGLELSPLQMPVSEAEPYLFTDLPEATYKRLPAMLSDACQTTSATHSSTATWPTKVLPPKMSPRWTDWPT